MIFFSCAQIGLAQIGLSMWYAPTTIPWSVQYPGVFLIFILEHDVVVLSCLSHKVNGSSKNFWSSGSIFMIFLDLFVRKPF